MPGVRDVKRIVKPTEEDALFIFDPVRKDAEQLFRQGLLGNAVMVVQPGLGRPADVKGGVDVLFGPVHQAA